MQMPIMLQNYAQIRRVYARNKTEDFLPYAKGYIEGRTKGGKINLVT